MDYEHLTDDEINKAVAELLGFDVDMSIPVAVKDGVPISLPAFCSNPSDAWPMIINFKINISYVDNDENHWCSTNGIYEDNHVWHTNPLRAAMIVFLMIHEESNETKKTLTLPVT